MPQRRLIAALFTTLLQACSASYVDRDAAQIKAPFDGTKFDNLEPFPDKSFFQLMKWRLSGGSEAWPEFSETPQHKPAANRSEKLLVTVINHATVLVQMNGLNILTDPHYSDRASPLQSIGPKRVIRPGVKFADLPPIDIVLISHNHYDHLDLDTLSRLHERDRPKIYAGLGTRLFLAENGIDTGVDMDWWEASEEGPVTITFVPAQHWSARGLFDKREMLWGGFYIKGRKTIYFAGDTGYGRVFRTIHTSQGAPDVALMPIGAYEPRWFMKNAHVNPEEAVRAIMDLEARKAVGIHFGTFKLTNEGITRPVEALAEATKAAGLRKGRFLVPTFGLTITDL